MNMHREESPVGSKVSGGIDFTSRYNHAEIEALVRQAHAMRSREFARIFGQTGRAAGRLANAAVNTMQRWIQPGQRATLARR